MGEKNPFAVIQLAELKWPTSLRWPGTKSGIHHRKRAWRLAAAVRAIERLGPVNEMNDYSCSGQLERYSLKSLFITTGSGASSGASTITLRPGFPGL